MTHNSLQPKTPEFLTFHNLSQEHIQRVKNDLENFNWDFDDKDTNECYDQLISEIVQTYDKHCPLKKRKVDKNKIAIKSFMTNGLLTSRKTKQTMINNYCKKRTPEKRERLREYVKIYKQTCRLSDLMDTEKFIVDNKNNCRKIWKLAKGKLGIDRLQDSLTDKLLLENGNEITGDQNMANVLNEYFINVGHDITKLLNPSTSHKHYMRNVTTVPFSFRQITDNETKKIIYSMENKVTEGLDSMSNKLIKLIAPSIIRPLTRIINLSLTEGIFPDNMKIAKTIPLFKSGSEFSPNNYRPIFILATRSKVVEKVVYSQLEDHFPRHYITENQFRFLRAHSTQDAINNFLANIHFPLYLSS